MTSAPAFADLLISCFEPRADRDVAHYTALSNLPNLLGVSKLVQQTSEKEGSKKANERPGVCSLWATPVQFLNDRDELALGLKVLLDTCESEDFSAKNIIETFRQTPGELSTDVFQVSFSGRHDDLGQWRGYGDDGHGCSIVFGLKEAASLGHVSNWIIYDADAQRQFASRVLAELRGQKDESLVLRVLLGAASFMKNAAFSVEDEFRVIRFCSLQEASIRAVGRRLAPYVDVAALCQSRPQPKRVFIGPAWQLADLDPADQTRHHVYQGVLRTLSLVGLDSLVGVEASRGLYDPR